VLGQLHRKRNRRRVEHARATQTRQIESSSRKDTQGSKQCRIRIQIEKKHRAVLQARQRATRHTEAQGHQGKRKGRRHTDTELRAAPPGGENRNHKLRQHKSRHRPCPSSPCTLASAAPPGSCPAQSGSKRREDMCQVRSRPQEQRRHHWRRTRNKRGADDRNSKAQHTDGPDTQTTQTRPTPAQAQKKRQESHLELNGVVAVLVLVRLRRSGEDSMSDKGWQ
jgi:hypothetical protein